jgi:hypothetical protein
VSLGVLGVLVVSALAWVGVRGLMLRSAPDDAMHAATEMQQQLQASDIAAARGSAATLAAHRSAGQTAPSPQGHQYTERVAQQYRRTTPWPIAS